MKLSISVGIMAYNEEKNIGKLLSSLKTQRLKNIILSEIIVVSSGSTDKTNAIVKKFVTKNSSIKLITQPTRKGKAPAVNIFLSKAKKNILILMSADLLLEKNTLEKLISPFSNREIGLTGAHPIPVNDPKTFMGFASHFLWKLHHKVAINNPKMGEMIAFRKIFKRIPMTSSVDEANIEPLIRGQGYRAEYISDAIVYNKGPESVKEFIARRRHVYAGHLITKNTYSYEVSTMNTARIIQIILQNMEFSWRFFLYTPLVISLESYARFLGYLDYKFKRKSHIIWEITPSTKKLVKG